MNRHVWRDPDRAQDCLHGPSLWLPPGSVVVSVRCPECRARPGGPCQRRRERVPTHSSRYAEHHRQHCEGRDWSVDIDASSELTGEVERQHPAQRRENAMEPMQALVLRMAPRERVQVIDLLKDELARGWIPKRADLESALAAVRATTSETEDLVPSCSPQSRD